MITILEDNYHKEITCRKCYSKISYGMNDVTSEHYKGWNELPEYIKPFLVRDYGKMTVEQQMNTPIPNYVAKHIKCPLCGFNNADMSYYRKNPSIFFSKS